MMISRKNDNPLGIMQLMTALSSLRSFTCDGRGYYSNTQLLQVQVWLQCPLKELHLIGHSCELIAAIGALITKCSPTLELLEYNVLDDQKMKLIAQCCTKLTRIAWSLTALKDVHCLSRVCAANPNLLCVDFSRLANHEDDVEGAVGMVSAFFAYKDHLFITNDFVEQLSTLCPMLQEIVFDKRHDMLDFTVLPAVIGRCKDLKSICIRDTLLTFHSSRHHGSKCCDVTRIGHCDDSTDEESAISLINCITIPIRSFGGGDSFLWMNRQVCEVLIRHSGSMLREAALWLSDAVCTADVQLFLSSCPNLTSLSLGTDADDDEGFGCTMVDQSIVEALHCYCPLLRTLQLSFCANYVPESAVMQMLTDFRGNDMTDIAFNGCEFLTDAVLDKIEGLFPRLRRLSVRFTQMTRERVLQYVIRSASTLREFCPPTEDMIDWLKDELNAAVGMKHVSMLIF